MPYTPLIAARRDSRSGRSWGVLARFSLFFLVSLALVARTLATGDDAFAADASIVVKTLVLYTIMITGSIWEKVVSASGCSPPPLLGRRVLDAVLALHTLYLVMLLGAIGSPSSGCCRARGLRRIRH